MGEGGGGGIKEKVFKVPLPRWCKILEHHVTAAILVSQNNETAAMLVFQTNPDGVLKPKEQPSVFSQDHAQQAPLTSRNINKLYERHLSKNHKLFSDNVDYEHSDNGN